MPTMSKPRQDVEEAFDLRGMSRLHEHPSLRPLYAHQVALHQQRATLVDEVRLLRQQLHDVPSGEGFTAATSRRTIQDRLSEREREGAAIEDQLQQLGTEIARVEAPLWEQVGTLRTQESVAVLAQFVSALEALAAASEAYHACCQRNYGLTMSYILPQGWLDPLLPSRVAIARQRLEQLRLALAQLQD